MGVLMPAGVNALGRLSVVTLLLVVCGLTACGFHLRGSGGTAALDVDGLYISQGPASGELVTALGRALRSAGATLADDRSAARVVLDLKDERRDKRVLSVGSAGKVQQYELHYAITFAAADAAGKVLAETQTVSLMRNITYNESDVLAKGNEEQRLLDDMRRDAIRQVVLRLDSALSKP